MYMRLRRRKGVLTDRVEINGGSVAPFHTRLIAASSHVSTLAEESTWGSTLRDRHTVVTVIGDVSALSVGTDPQTPANHRQRSPSPHRWRCSRGGVTADNPRCRSLSPITSTASAARSTMELLGSEVNRAPGSDPN